MECVFEGELLATIGLCMVCPHPRADGVDGRGPTGRCSGALHLFDWQIGRSRSKGQPVNQFLEGGDRSGRQGKRVFGRSWTCGDPCAALGGLQVRWATLLRYSRSAR